MVHLDSSAGCRCIAMQYFNLVQLILFLELTNKLQVATIRESWATWPLSSAVLRDSRKLSWLIPEWSNGYGYRWNHCSPPATDLRISSPVTRLSPFICSADECSLRRTSTQCPHWCHVKTPKGIKIASKNHKYPLLRLNQSLSPNLAFLGFNLANKRPHSRRWRYQCGCT
jgi:hypothetical protein